MWWDRKGTLNLPLVVFSAPTKKPKTESTDRERRHPCGDGIASQATEEPGGDRRYKPHAADQNRVVFHANFLHVGDWCCRNDRGPALTSL
jgi:hypothetical protein